MKKYIKLWKQLLSEFSGKEVLSAFYGALIYTSLIAILVLATISQIVSVYLYYLTLWIVLIIIVMALLTYIFHYFWFKALVIKKPETKTDIKTLFLINQIIIDTVYLIVGLLFIFVFVPMLMV